MFLHTFLSNFPDSVIERVVVGDRRVQFPFAVREEYRDEFKQFITDPAMSNEKALAIFLTD